MGGEKPRPGLPAERLPGAMKCLVDFANANDGINELHKAAIEYDYPAFHLSMDCFWCEVVSGELVLKEAEAARWLTKDDIDSVPWLPADQTILDVIRSSIDAAEEAVPGAQEEILTGHIKATDEQIVALASIPKEERPAILEELKKKKSDRDDTVLERLKPSKPPPKPKPAPQKKKPTATENNTASQAEQPETSVQEPITESPPEAEILRQKIAAAEKS